MATVLYEARIQIWLIEKKTALKYAQDKRELEQCIF